MAREPLSPDDGYNTLCPEQQSVHPNKENQPEAINEPLCWSSPPRNQLVTEGTDGFQTPDNPISPVVADRIGQPLPKSRPIRMRSIEEGRGRPSVRRKLNFEDM